ncbi:hypothetical protein ACFLY7_00890 [Patescibacteria group bacterium]
MKNNKKIVFILLVAVLVLAVGYFYSESKEEFKLITNDEELSEFMQNMDEGDLEEYLAKKDELYSQDVYGGDTPEETLDLFIDALKKGDVELASRYFRLEDQEGELEELIVLSKEKTDNYVDFLGMKDKIVRYNEFFDTYEIDVFHDNDNVLVAKLGKNKQTGKWKLESL